MSFTSSDLVLVTGANGHVAQHIVDQLLSLPSPPRVRGTVRSEAKAAEIRAHYAHVDPHQLEIVVISDMTPEGIFDTALEGVTHIAHVASPLIISREGDVEKNVLQPAIAGTTSILRSAAKSATVKRAVVTSSFGAECDFNQGWRPGYTYTEKDFNPLTRADLANPNFDLPNAEPVHKQYATYATSKVLAEKAAWDIASSSSCPFTLSVIVPTYIFGPSILPLSHGADSLSFSNKLVWRTATAAGKEHLPLDWPHEVDVRDVARAHVVALQKEEAQGQRFNLSNEPFSYSQLAKLIKKHFPAFETSEGPDQDFERWNVDGSKALRILLNEYIPFETSVVETLKQIV